MGLGVFQEKGLQRKIFPLMLIWMSLIFAYFLISFQMKYLDPAHIYSLSVWTSITEIIGKLSAGSITLAIGLRPMFFLSFGVAITGIFFLAIFDPNTTSSTNITIFMLLARFGASMAVSGANIAIIMLMPTKVVGSANGVCTFVASIMALFAPIIAEMPLPWPMITLECFMVMSAIAVLFLSEDSPDSEGTADNF
jgi:nitrate/nitrite transporter NarK